MLYKRLKDKIITHKIKKRFPTSNVNIKCSFDNKTILEGFNVLNYMSNVCSSKIGFCSVVGQKSILTNCSIGRFCSIAANVCVVDATHPLNFVSTYPSFFNTSNDYPFKKGETFFNEFLHCSNGYSANIGNDVWIGEHVLIKGGVTIGDGAVVGMGAVVTKDIPPYAIVAGIPAKIIKYRFDDATIAKLLKIKWWYWDIDFIHKRREDFTNIFNFVNKYYNQ